jgi:DNA-binding HxlR family transcriptional regulator
MKQTALEPTCPVGTAISLLSGRWRSSIVCALLDEHPAPVRFMDLQRRTTAKARAPISRKVLRDELHALQQKQLIIRESEGVKAPLQTRYSLTPWGSALGPVTDALARWADNAACCATPPDQGSREGKRGPKRAASAAGSE